MECCKKGKKAFIPILSSDSTIPILHHSNTPPLHFLILACLCFALPGFVSAEKQPELKFLKTTDLSHIGLRIKLMPNATASPLPSPKVMTYTFTRQDKSWKTDMYSPLELWVRSQHAGKWIDEDGNTLVLASITKRFPVGFSGEHVTKEEYEKKLAEANKDPGAWTADAINQWVADFTCSGSAQGKAVTKKPIKLKSLVSYSLEGDSKSKLAYVFRLNQASTSLDRSAANWFFVMVEPNPGITGSKAREAVEKSFLDTVSTSVASRITTGGLSSKFQAGGFLKDKDKSAVFKESRQTAVDSIRNMQDWWHVETDNYVMLSNLKKRYGIMVKDLQKNVELLRFAYEEFIPPRAEISAVSVIRVFATPNEYEAYVGDHFKWSGGLWLPSRAELIIRPIDWGGSKDQRDIISRVTYHEAFHQYIFYALSQQMTSPWFNEGHAEFFEMAEVKNGKITIEEDEDQYNIVEKLIDLNKLDIKEMLYLDYKSFYSIKEETRNQNYALAWAIIYYLRKGSVLDKNSPYAKLLEKYIDDLWKTRDPVKATDSMLKDVDLKQFSNDFSSFWKSRNMRGAAKRNRIFSGYGLRKGR